ncbi:MAG TPA: hypothetical protein VGI39_39795 [Polyangiaceae bacterium]|jgi:hypothetical protein
MALPTAATLGASLAAASGMPNTSPGYAAAVTQWTAIATALLAAIQAGTVTVNLADGTGIAPGVSTGSSDVNLSGTVTGSMT